MPDSNYFLMYKYLSISASIASIAMDKSGILNIVYKPFSEGYTAISEPRFPQNQEAQVWLKAFQATLSLLDLGTVALPALTL